MIRLPSNLNSRSMRNLYLLSVLLLLMGCNTPANTDQTLLDERITRIENGLMPRVKIEGIETPRFNIEDRMRHHGIPGVSIAVFTNGEIEWAKGYGLADSSENRKVTTETLFLAGSISKPVAALRTHQLTEQGLIHLDSNVNNYLKSWQLPDNEFTINEKVTPRRIMNHTAGLTIWGFRGYQRGDTIPSTTEILDGKGNTNAVRVYKEPGGDWQYSGGGYTIMQQMIEDLDQKPFTETMRSNVLTPLGMANSTYENPLPASLHSKAATGYNSSNGEEVPGKWFVYPEMAAAGLWTTPTELGLWANEIQKTLLSQTDGFLKAKTVNEMLTDNKDDQGLGPYVTTHIFGHGGLDAGFMADLYAWRESANVVVIMTNSDGGNLLVREIMLSMAEEYGLPGIYTLDRVFRKKSTAELEKYTGTYRFLDGSEATIILKDEGIEFFGGPFADRNQLLPENDSTFFNKATGTYYRFTLEGDKVTGVGVSRYKSKKID